MNVTFSALLVAIALFFTGCGATTTCGPSNCATGCCDANDKCQAGQGTLQCGTNGNSCAACGGLQICQLGICTGLTTGTGGFGGATGGGFGGATGGGVGGATGGGVGGETGGGVGGATGGGVGGATGGGVGGATGGGVGGATGGGVGGSTGGGVGGSCGPIMAGNPPFPRRCAVATNNECDATTNQFLSSNGVQASLLNGSSGNGFDDDCDGLVDEGCGCPAAGTTKDCSLVPATQADATRRPVGWCAANAVGSLDCSAGSTWSGVCRGALQPARTDSCAPGDFDCDGLSANNQTQGCQCATEVACPTTTLQLAPYPDPTALTAIDGTLWIQDAAQRGAATGWTWTVLGGDCDNVLPNPTFALYSSAAGVAANQRGSRRTVSFDSATQRYVESPTAPLAAIRASGADVTGRIYPAFGLSGDYLVQGEFSLNGKSFSCTQRVAVRAPGIRAELCWDTVGNRDVDLHFARLQGVTCSSGKQGFLDACGSMGAAQDCHYATCTGAMSWGYAPSPNAACKGWSSKRGTASCDNPRLDRDNVSCTPSVTDPTASTFCGPENINLDNPVNQDKFVVGVNFYSGGGGLTAAAKPHVNLYCNGRRVLSAGYNPATGETAFPLLKNSGQRTTGDFWKVATIKANVSGGVLTSCDVETLPAHVADPIRDGPTTAYCVDSKTNASPSQMFNYIDHAFINAGSSQGITGNGVPMTAAQWCKH